MKLLLKGHEIKQDLRELIRIIFDYEEIQYIKDISEYNNQGILLYNELVKEAEEYMLVKIYEDGDLIGQSSICVDWVEVYIDEINKKRNVAVKKAIITATNSFSRLPWGILTGIRPMKIVHNLFDKSIEDSLIKKVFTKEYLLHREKVDLLLEIGKRQRKYIDKNKGKYSLYVSIPFCPSRCLYCSFPSLPIDLYDDYIEEYIKTLLYEIKSVKELMDGSEINTVYIGGGTPTSIPVEDLEKIIQYIYELFARDNIKEFTVEAGRPDTINREYLAMLKDNQIDRISINPQTMNDKTLNLIGRNHSSKDIKEVYKVAKELKFKSINMDLIVGLPDEKLEDIEYTLSEIEKLDPDNLTVHTLAVKTNSKFSDKMDEYDIKLEDDMKKVSSLIDKFIDRNSYQPYYLYRQKQSVSNLENVGYAKEGKDCIYNISMMEERETIISVGMGGVSKIYMGEGRIERIPNFKGLNDYLNRVDELIERKNKILNIKKNSEG